MEMQPGQMAYDRTITVFSPDGRLFQVEYAREAVKRGSTTVGIVYKEGVVFLADKRVPSKLAEFHSIEKISQIDEHIGCTTSGLVADARVLVDYARIIAQINKVTYGERIGVDILVKKICDFKQQYTQYGGVRPFGTSLIIGGWDDTGVHLFETDPSGSLTAFKATSIGGSKNIVMEYFEEKYNESLTLDDAILLGLYALSKAAQEESSALTQVEIAYIKNREKYRKLEESEVQKYRARIPIGKEKSSPK